MARRRQTCIIALLSTLTVGLSLVSGPGAAASPAWTGPSPSPDSVLRQLAARSHGHSRIARDPATGRVTFVGADGGAAVARPADAGASGSGEPAARAYLRHLAPLSGVSDRAVRPTAVTREPWGTTVRFQQLAGGLPLVGGEVTVSMDRAGALQSYAAHTSDATITDTAPQVTAATAVSSAVALLARSRRFPAGALAASAPVLSVYDAHLLGAPGQRQQQLVWRTEVTAAAHPDVRELVLVDAHRGTIALHFSEVDHATGDVPQRVCDFGETPSDDPTCTTGDTARVVQDPADSTNDDERLAYENAAKTAAFYQDVLGRDSIDGQGMPIVSTVHYCPDSRSCPYDNAFWDGEQMVYGDGLPAALDVVGHELTHGVTDHTSGLFYFFQSGAINESMSDVMGELIDQLEGTVAPADLWLVGQDAPNDSRGLHDLRSMKDPTSSLVGAQPDRMTSPHYASGFDADGVIEDSGDVHANSGVGNKAAYLLTEGTRLEPDGSFNGRAFAGVTDNDGNPLSGTDADGGATTDSRREVLEKVANIYYALELRMPSGTSYSDLYRLLPQACDALVSAGQPVRGLTFRAADCTAVRDAVAATEMDRSPTVTGAAPATPAPYCTNGGAKAAIWSDGFESASYSASHWVATPGPPGPQSPIVDQNAWFTSAPPVSRYARTGEGNLWGDDPGLPDTASTTATSPYARRLVVATRYPIRAHVGTYLWFAHAFSFDSFGGDHFDGGRVEVTTDNGAHWSDAGRLLVNNGYTGTLLPRSAYQDPATANPDAGRRAFVGASRGYTASRLDLSSLAGRSVRFRFVVSTDRSIGDYGWFIDDVQAYSCNASVLSLTRPGTISYGSPVTLTGRLVKADTAAPLAGAVVQLFQRAHGSSPWGWPMASTRTSSTGGYAFTGLRPLHSVDYLVTFAGAAPVGASSTSTTIGVAPRVTLHVADATLWLGQRLTVTGSVSPNHHGQQVVLQRYLGAGRWATLSRATLSSRSGYVMTWRPGVRGAFLLRVVKASDGDHATGTSPTMGVRVS